MIQIIPLEIPRRFILVRLPIICFLQQPFAYHLLVLENFKSFLVWLLCCFFRLNGQRVIAIAVFVYHFADVKSFKCVTYSSSLLFCRSKYERQDFLKPSLRILSNSSNKSSHKTSFSSSSQNTVKLDVATLYYTSLQLWLECSRYQCCGVLCNYFGVHWPVLTYL